METIILLNDDDLKDGFFKIGTSKKKIYEKILRRVGGRSELLDVKESISQGKVSWWEIKIPKIFLSKSNLGVRKKPTKPRKANNNLRPKND